MILDMQIIIRFYNWERQWIFSYTEEVTWNDINQFMFYVSLILGQARD